MENCTAPNFCFHCEGAHSPNSRQFPRYRFEQEVKETAETEHISIGSAKRKVLGANKTPNSSYAAIAKDLRKEAGHSRGNNVPPLSSTLAKSQTINTDQDKSSVDKKREEVSTDIDMSLEEEEVFHSLQTEGNGKTATDVTSSTGTINRMTIDNAQRVVDEDGFIIPSGTKRKSRTFSVRSSDSDVETYKFVPHGEEKPTVKVGKPERKQKDEKKSTERTTQQERKEKSKEQLRKTQVEPQKNKKIESEMTMKPVKSVMAQRSRGTKSSTDRTDLQYL